MPATILHGGTIGNGSMPADVYNLIDTATISGITGSEIANNTVTNSNLQAITTAGKVSGAAITALASIPSAAGRIPAANTPTSVTLPEITAPSTAASTGALYTKDTGGQPELFFREESDGDEVQITSGGEVGTTTSTSAFVIKAWAYVTYSGGTPTLAASYNVSGITDTNTGKLTVTWDTDFANTNYVVVATPETPAATFLMSSQIESKTAGACVISTWQSGGALADPTAIHVMAIGAQ